MFPVDIFKNDSYCVCTLVMSLVSVFCHSCRVVCLCVGERESRGLWSPTNPHEQDFVLSRQQHFPRFFHNKGSVSSGRQLFPVPVVILAGKG